MTRRYVLDHPKAHEIATALAQLAAKPGAFGSPESPNVAGLVAFTQLGDPSSPRFSRRLTDLMSQRSTDDPSMLAQYQADAKAEFLARRGVPPWAARARIRAEAERHAIRLD